MPVVRGMLALRVKGPLLAVQEAAAGLGGGTGALTATVADCWLVPPEPVQDRL